MNQKNLIILNIIRIKKKVALTPHDIISQQLKFLY